MNQRKINIDNVEYVRADTIIVSAESFSGMEYVIVRTYSAGVFAGYLESRDGKEATIRHARRLWYWEGAASLSQLAMEGTNKPSNCKFSVPVERTIVTEVIEVLSCTQTAKDSIGGVREWRV